MTAACLATRVVPCTFERSFYYKGFGPLDALTAVASHELIESVIDPEPFANPAYRVLDGANGYWIWARGGEAADMCSGQSDPYGIFPGFDYTVARSWSNKAAVALHDPCVPVPGVDTISIRRRFFRICMRSTSRASSTTPMWFRLRSAKSCAQSSSGDRHASIRIHGLVCWPDAGWGPTVEDSIYPASS